MRRNDREVTDINKIYQILQKGKVVHLGLLDGDYPYVVALHYGFSLNDGKLTLYMHSAHEGHKLDILSKSSPCFIEIDCDINQISGGDIACQYGSEYSSIMGRGRAYIVKDVAEKIEGLKLLMKNQTEKDFLINPEMAAMVTVIKVSVEDFNAKACTKANF